MLENDVLEIKGKVNTALCYAKVVEDEAVEQIRKMCDCECTRGSRIRIMPDVHAGKGCTIGTTMTITDKAVPNVVGVDIGCGMYTVNLGRGDIDFEKMDAAAHFVPSGKHVWEGRQERFDLLQLRCYRSLKDAKRLERSIGTLGGGNHFIEIDRDGEGAFYLVIHSGSRHLGVEVTEYYLREGQKASQTKKQGYAPYDLTCLEGELLGQYLHDLEIVQEFAGLNREAMVDEIVRGMKWKVLDSYTCIHNYIDFSADVPLLRKGAISAKAGEPVVIPINMRDGIILGKGLGNEDWNCSAPHGSGRIYRRSEVKEHHTVSEFRRAMEGIYSICINKDTLDESPFAYRSIEDMLKVVGDTVAVDKVIRPVYNFKAGGDK